METLAQRGGDLGNEAVALGKANNAQNIEILEQLKAMQGQVTEVTEETKDGVRLSQKVTRWGKTIEDLHIKSLARNVLKYTWPLMIYWGLVRVFGPEVAAAIAKRFTGRN